MFNFPLDPHLPPHPTQSTSRPQNHSSSLFLYCSPYTEESLRSDSWCVPLDDVWPRLHDLRLTLPQNRSALVSGSPSAPTLPHLCQQTLCHFCFLARLLDMSPPSFPPSAGPSPGYSLGTESSMLLSSQRKKRGPPLFPHPIQMLSDSCLQPLALHLYHVMDTEANRASHNSRSPSPSRKASLPPGRGGGGSKEALINEKHLLWGFQHGPAYQTLTGKQSLVVKKQK